MRASVYNFQQNDIVFLEVLPHADSVFSTLTYMFRSVQGVEANQLSYRSVFHHKMLVSLFVPIDH